MSHCRHTDIVFELMDLSHTRMDQVRCQMMYYRASVYKHETQSAIDSKIAELRVLTSLFGEEAFHEAFSDFDAMAGVPVASGAAPAKAGECSLSSRVTMLLGVLDLHLSLLYKNATRRTLSDEHKTLAEAVRAKRAELLTLVPQGSRQWTFFQNL